MREVVLASGRLAYRETGRGRPLVFVHGLLADGHVWDRMLPALSSFRCLIPDWPMGAHNRPCPPEADLSAAGLTRQVAEFLSKLELRDVVLVGSHSGGALCQRVARNHPDRLGGLVLTNCDIHGNLLPPALRYLQGGARLPGFVWLLAQGMRRAWFRRLPLVTGWLSLTNRASCWASLERAGLRRDLRRLLLSGGWGPSDFQLPTLVAWSPHDYFYPWTHAERLTERVPGARLVAIPDSLTLVSLDQPELLARAISDTFQRPDLN